MPEESKLVDFSPSISPQITRLHKPIPTRKVAPVNNDGEVSYLPELTELNDYLKTRRKYSLFHHHHKRALAVRAALMAHRHSKVILIDILKNQICLLLNKDSHAISEDILEKRWSQDIHNRSGLKKDKTPKSWLCRIFAGMLQTLDPLDNTQTPLSAANAQPTVTTEMSIVRL